MQRAIVGFLQDAGAAWVAQLSCGHGQHVRHTPPFTLRPWVLTEEGRASKLGQLLECLRCDRFEMPEGFAPYKRTPEFTNDTIPAGLLRDHQLKAGTWGKLQIAAGQLAFTFCTSPPQPERLCTPAAATIIPPETLHFIKPLGPVRFSLEFWGLASPLA